VKAGEALKMFPDAFGKSLVKGVEVKRRIAAVKQKNGALVFAFDPVV